MAERGLVLDAGAMRVHLTNLLTWAGGSQRALSRRLNVSQREISQAVRGLRPVSRSVARALGFNRVVEPRRVLYRKVPCSAPGNSQ